MKEQLNKLILDIEIIKEAVTNKDNADALQMLEEFKQDLKLLALIS